MEFGALFRRGGGIGAYNGGGRAAEGRKCIYYRDKGGRPKKDQPWPKLLVLRGASVVGGLIWAAVGKGLPEWGIRFESSAYLVAREQLLVSDWGAEAVARQGSDDASGHGGQCWGGFGLLLKSSGWWRVVWNDADGHSHQL